MDQIKVCLIQLIGFTCLLLPQIYSADEENIEFTNRIIMDSERRYTLFWYYNTTHIVFEAQVETLGYVGFGISPDGRMKGSDIVIGWVAGDKSYFQDRYGMADDQEPKLDRRQDWHLQMSFKNDTHTVLRFDRKLDTCDEEDLPITTDTLRLIYSYHPEVPTNVDNLPYHGETRRGQRSAVLLGPTSNLTNFPRDTRAFELRMPDIAIPYHNFESIYMCKTFRLPRFFTKTHIIAYEPALQMDNEPIVQQIIMYRCYGPPNVFDDVAIFNGRVCSKRFAVEKLCMQPFAFWSRKNEGFYFPDSVGLPLEANAEAFVMIQILYRNAYSKMGYTDNSGLKFYYTQNLRMFDVGFSKVSAFETGIDLLIPPKQVEIKRQAICSSDCTTMMLPQQGIEIFAMCPHTHSLGRRITVRHIRNNRELPEFMHDNGYDPEYQTCHLLKRFRRLLPGDQIIVDCIYDSMNRYQVTRGGINSTSEVCTVFIMFYPNYNFISCQSGPAQSTSMQALGVTSPFPGTTIVRDNEGRNRTLLNYINDLNWDNQMSRSYQNSILNDAVHYACFALNDRGVITPRQEINSVPQYLALDQSIYDYQCGYSIRSFGGPRADGFTQNDYQYYNSVECPLSSMSVIIFQLFYTILLLRL